MPAVLLPGHRADKKLFGASQVSSGNRQAPSGEKGSARAVDEAVGWLLFIQQRVSEHLELALL